MMDSESSMIPWNPESEIKLRNDDQYACLLRLYEKGFLPKVGAADAFKASSKSRSMLIIFRGRRCVELVLIEDETREVFSAFVSTIGHACDAAVLWLERFPLEAVTDHVRPFEVVRKEGHWVPKYD